MLLFLPFSLPNTPSLKRNQAPRKSRKIIQRIIPVTNPIPPKLLSSPAHKGPFEVQRTRALCSGRNTFVATSLIAGGQSDLPQFKIMFKEPRDSLVTARVRPSTPVVSAAKKPAERHPTAWSF